MPYVYTYLFAGLIVIGVYIRNYIPAYTELHTFSHTNMHTYIHTCMHAYIHTTRTLTYTRRRLGAAGESLSVFPTQHTSYAIGASLETTRNAKSLEC